MTARREHSSPPSAPPQPIDPHVRIGHVHLRTADIDRVRAFYVDLLGFDVVYEARDVPAGAPRATCCSSPRRLSPPPGFNTWKSKGAARSPTASPVFTTSPSCSPRRPSSPGSSSA